MILSAEDLMKRLETIPHGSTIRPEVARRAPSKLAAPPWEGVVPPPLDLPCAVETCRNRVTHPGICHACGAARESDDARAEFAGALDSIPEFFRWTTRGAPEIDERVSTAAHTGARPRVLAERAAADLVSGAAKVILVRGARDAGKTSFACAVAQVVIATAVEEWIRYSRREGRRAKVQDRAPVYQEPKICGIARGLFFAAARDIVPPAERGEDAPQPKYGRLIRARLAVIDELGQELEAREDSAATSKRLKATSDVICHMWDRGAPVLATTWMTDEQIYQYYRGGVQKRLCKSEHVRVIELKGKSA